VKFVKNVLLQAVGWSWRLFIVAVIFFNLRLYWPSPLAARVDAVPRTLVSQLAANRSAIDAGAPTQMQDFFPEGFYFCYVFHGLTWVELAIRDKSFTQRAIDEAQDCLAKLDSPQGQMPFPSYLPPDHGMFYSAWKCSLLAGIVRLQNGSDTDQLSELRRQCDQIIDAIENAETPFLASYDGSAWPCDTMPAIHAMTVHDRITGVDRYRDAIANWLSEAQERSDPETGLLPHTAKLPDGRQVGVARATSQVIMLRLLPDIDPVFAKAQYQRFRDRFLTTFVGAPCALEYPSGISGPGDIDSGPLIYGRSIVGTVMMIALAQVYGDQSLADAIAQTGETIGMPWTSNEQKTYVGGILPVGNIIVAYAQVARPWYAITEHYPDLPHRITSLWRWKIHLGSSIVFLPILLPRITQRKKRH
jgi:hypothetical protein